MFQNRNIENVCARGTERKYGPNNGTYDLVESNANRDLSVYLDGLDSGIASDISNGNADKTKLNKSYAMLENEVAPDLWSSMESSNSILRESDDIPDSNGLDSCQSASSSSLPPATANSSHRHPVVLTFSTQTKVCYGTTEAVIESGASPKRRHHVTRSDLNGQRSQSKHSSKNRNTNFTSDLEGIELLDDDTDEPSTSSQRKPHFLDEDYHLQRSDVCRIPKPHFLDHSPSPDEERLSDITNPHFLDEVPEEKTSNGGPSRRRDVSKSYVPCRLKDNNSSRDNLEERHTLERRYRNGVQHNDVLPGQASTSSDRHSTHSYDGGWLSEREMWQNQDSCSVKSFSSAGSGNTSAGSHQQLRPKVDCVYSLLSLLSLSADSNADMSEYLLEMSHTVESCIAMRQSGCIPLLVQLIHSKLSRGSRNKAARALHNMIHAQPDDKAGRREARVLRLLEHVREYCQFLEDLIISLKEEGESVENEMSKHPVQSVAALMKLSFDEEHRHVMCQLGALQSLASLVTIDQAAHGSMIENDQCVTMRKYSGMALTNLTFGDGNNKALLCSFKDFMRALVDQLQSPNDDMRQVTAAVLRNLSWRADTASKKILREVGAVKGLTVAAMTGHKEATLKSVLSALWNLTAHCSLNKVDICSVDGALAFLVDMLSFNAPSKTLAIIENAGGILRNISNHIAVREDYRQILREHNCLKVLLQQLKSPSLTIVSNSCGTLWNLSARCQQDQQYLWDHGAVPMLRSLIHSKHKMIAMGSSAALKNLLNSKPGKTHIMTLDSTARDLNLPVLPTLGARKQKALEQELDQNLAETCENIEPVTSPTTSNRDEKLLFSAAERHLAMSIEKRRMSSSSPLMGHLASQISLSHSSHFGGYLSCSNTLLLQSSLQKGHMSRTMVHGRHENVNRSESKDSVTSTHSDSVYERVARNSKIPNHGSTSDRILEKARGSCNSVNSTTSRVDRDFIKRYSKGESLMKYEHLSSISSRHNTDMTRNNFSELTYDENESCDQPIDYGKKYSETKSSEIQNQIDEYGVQNTLQVTKIKSEPTNTKSNSHQNKIIPPVNYTDYQETDLDQPTDYSLRYAEDQSDVTSELSEGRPPSIHEDTIKHFCTEGTPYETPINFSTATSMSDLRMIGTGLPIGEKPIKIESNSIDDEPALVAKQSVEVMSQSDEKDTCSLEEVSKHDNDRVLASSRNSTNQVVPQSSNTITYDSKFSSGMISPEKPVNYCEEGTPGYFSRVSSLSSLEEGANVADKDDNWNAERTDEVELAGNFTPPIAEDAVEEDQSKEKDGGKVVTFSTSPGVLNYAEETPLMFSRCSSLESLSGCSVPDQPDDVGSVVSEFSRMTSGCISPSEIPDSPTHSPLPRGESSGPPPPQPNRLLKPVVKSPPQPATRLRSMFEDQVSTFKCEHTPVQFSTGTSLSSLTIDDEPTSKVPFVKAFDTEKRTEGVGSSNPDENRVQGRTTSGSLSDDNSIGAPASADGEQEDDILAACISEGVQSGIKIRGSNMGNRIASMITSSPNGSLRQKSLHMASSDPTQPSMDTILTYYTEDTPALLSKAGSHSNLSALSLPENEEDAEAGGSSPGRKEDLEPPAARDYSDESSDLSGDSGNLLAECIRSGMPQKIQEDYQESRCSPKRNPQPRGEPPLRITQNGLPAYLVAGDEVESYAIEGSPFQHSLSSSLSDLTIDSHTGSKARLIKSSQLVPPVQGIPEREHSSPPRPRRSSSPSGSLSSVDLGSDDGHLLDMVIQAGVPKLKDGPSCYMKDKTFNNPARSPSLVEENKHYDSNIVDDKSEELATVLIRHDSLSSLSVDSLGSNEGEQALFEQCIKSGMPKDRPARKWDDIHSRTLDKNFKARSADRNTSEHHVSHTRSHKSLERNKDDSKSRHIERDPDFESLVVAGAFRSCAQKLSKAEDDRIDRALLQEAIYCGMPKRRDKMDNPYRDAVVPNPPVPHQNDLFYTQRVDDKQATSSHENFIKGKNLSNPDFSKNVLATSVATDNSLSCSPSAPLGGAPQAATDVKNAVQVGNTAKNTKLNGQLNHNLDPQNTDKINSKILEQTAPGRGGLNRKLSSNGEAFEDFPYMMNGGSETHFDETDGNKLPKLAPDMNSSFNDSVFDKSNECRALDTSACLDDSIVSDLNQSNESCANILNQSNNELEITPSNDLNHVGGQGIPKSLYENINVETSIMASSLKTLVQSRANQINIETAMGESVTEKSSSGKVEKHSSTDTWNENTCSNDVSFPTVSGSIPLIASFKSDVGDEITCAGTLPDLLEESVVVSDGPNQPDLTNQLKDNIQNYIKHTPTGDPKPFIIGKNFNQFNIAETNDFCAEFENLSINNVPKEQKPSTLDSIQHSFMLDDCSSKHTSMTASTLIENEAAMLARAIRESSYDYSTCLTESGHSLHSLDLDSVKPPSHMGSLLSLTHSLSGHWEDNHAGNLERDKLHSSLTKRSISKVQRKKSLPVGLMIKRALGFSHSNQGSSENLDCHALSNLENVKPPSEMDDVFDMENSMISVASIVSEVADTQDEDTSTIIFDLKQPVSGSHLSSIPINLDIDNINPPSLFDELTESTLENDYDDENCLTHTLAYCPEIPSGSDSGTPIASDFGSSAESTPKKVKSINKKHLTPRQKRQLTKDRYKTYTIAAEMAIKEEESRMKEMEVPYVPPAFNTNCESPPPNPENRERRSRSNPKQRRQEDRARYQTQTVNISNFNLPVFKSETKEKPVVKDPEIEELKRRLEAKKSMKQKRQDNADRFRTRTLDESFVPSPSSTSNEKFDSARSSIPKPSSSLPQTNIPDFNDTFLSDDVKNAFDFLQQHSTEESLMVDLDCETISLVSNEDDSELNSLRMKTFTKSFRNYLPVIESPTAVDKCIEKNLKNMSHTSSVQISSLSFVHKTKLSSDTNGHNYDFNSLECDQNSGTESADQNQYSDSEVESPQIRGKPKIVKPDSDGIHSRDRSVESNGSVEVEETVPKAIRGRRKALYVSPYKKNSSSLRKSPARTTLTNKGSVASKMSNGAITKGQNGVKNTTNLTKITHTSVKGVIGSINKNNLHVPKSKGNVLPRNKSPKNVTEVVSPKPTLVRQGTFTKEESSVISSPAASPRTPEKRISPNSKLTKPGTIMKTVVNTSPSRLPQPPVKGSVSKPPLRKATSNESAVAKTSTPRPGNVTARVSPSMKNSSSNQSLQSNDSGKTITLSSKNNTTKCSSSSSVNSAVSTSKPQTKDVTSKIANLWKKVEQSKKTSKPDTRVWITSNANGSQENADTAEPSVEISTKSKLIRSSTFEGSPKAVSSIPVTPKQKSSIAIRVSQSPSSRYNSKVPVVRTSAASNGGLGNAAFKRGKT